MIKNTIKKMIKFYFLEFLKIRNKFDDQIKSIIHKRFINKISNKTELKNYNFLNNDKSNELSQLCEKYGSIKGILILRKKFLALKPTLIQTYIIIYLIIAEKILN